MEKFLNLILYFLIAILFIGTMGIWLPVCIDYFSEEKIDKYSFLQNSATYFISIAVAGCLELTKSVIENINLKNKVGLVFLSVLVLLVSIALVVLAIVFSIKENFGVGIWIVSAGIILSWILWWLSNFQKGDVNPANALGGNIEE
ncbi:MULTISPECIES: hypothetical protein [Leeuwenhoekiella]|uniref:hypothetical protein n=1 Tax=Leeuwenhoekiella TaxID=283735 RepID=UPI002353EC89|nr:hypothetical protein [Leeuwenhoekiella blandensis]|tara:strand:+ start:1806 stop:2240 length:435 start_codon:yes stop_codon:yes gene_type:complete